MQNLDFYFALSSGLQLLDGLWVTLYLTIWSNVIGLTCGFLLALVGVSQIRPLRWLYTAYVEIFRCTPILLQIVWFFFCVPILFNVYWSGEFLGLLILGLNLTAFNAEAYRASIQGIPPAHHDAAIALGLGRRVTALYVVMPQAARNAMPVLVTNAIGAFQQSALVALVGVADLMYQGKLLSTQTYRPIEAYTSVALIYLVISVTFGQVAGFLERRSELYR
ncbi:amino acid ABC transporter permease [Rhizobium sp. CCGE 510]|uniref:amino acid ABC transporter permease n=1 Tax=Rhizobium sp. CCGE 510 TaxID=1132836 RepID=UPI00027B80C7|nr:amino acid ABC transporter permease [Rhizobium sp. CCGE 510]EJT06232.1 polar amino acid ABC transporter inner membrane subunit [Rhizobium sp. CCGE 510]